jgi:hypothetical protein
LELIRGASTDSTTNSWLRLLGRGNTEPESPSLAVTPKAKSPSTIEHRHRRYIKTEVQFPTRRDTRRGDKPGRAAALRERADRANLFATGEATETKPDFTACISEITSAPAALKFVEASTSFSVDPKRP